MKRWMRGRGLLAATAMTVLCAGFAAPAWARTNHAVLVAVTAYPNLPPKTALIGPNHDAKLVRDYLTTNAPVKFEPANVTLLADGIDGAASSPTHANILAALKEVAAKAVRDDFVYLHFSGHGAQQPTLTAATETDGLDEIFLPADSSKWDDQAKHIPNALLDDEIGAALDTIRNKGAFVWVIFDACHSGSATRAAPVGEEAEYTDRKLDSNDLGIPASALPATPPATRGMSERKTGFQLLDESGGDVERAALLTGSDQSATGAQSIAKGGLVAFFAAQTIETTPEMPLPKGTPGAEKFGLFTFTIFSKLAENPNMTYRQLGHAVLQQYSADSRQRPTPLFEGELDARVFGTEKLDTIMQWQVEVKDNAATLPAGRLHRLAPGTKLAILPSPASELSAAVGYLEVKSAKNLSSTVVPVAFDGKPALKLADLPPNAFARLAELTIDFKLKVARPAAAEGLEDEVALANGVLDSLASAEGRRFNIELVGPGEEADIRLAVMRENALKGAAADASDQPALWFLPPSGELSLENGRRPPLVAIDASNVERLSKATGENLEKIFRVTSLSRLAAASDYRPDEVSVEFQIKRKKTDALEPLVEASVPIVTPGDEVHILARNTSSKPVDINILYLGSDYSITHIDAQRLVSGASIEEGLLAFTDTTFGTERMIAVLTEAPPMSEIEDLSFLQQGEVPPATRSVGGQSDFIDMIADIGLAPATRSVIKLNDKGEAKGAVMIYQIETVPLP